MNKMLVIIIIAVLLIGSIFIVNEKRSKSSTNEEQDEITSDGGINQIKIQFASGEWAPYVSEDLLFEGVVSRIVKESFKEESIEIEFVYRPWNRSLEETRNGKWHGTLPWLKNEEREKDFYYSEPIAYQTYVLFYLKDLDFTWEGITDLEGYTIGGTDGYSYGAEFDESITKGQITIERTTADEQNFQKLLSGRVDLVLCEINVGYDIIEKLSSEDADKITHDSKSVNVEPLYLLLSKKVEGNAELIVSFNRGLQSLSESGKVDQYWEESRKGEYKNE